MERIQKDVARMGSLVDDLLALSRLESGQTPLNLGPLNLRALTDDLLDSYSMQSNGVRIEQTMPVDLPLVTGDEGMVRQVLVNLLENALKFTSEGGRIGVEAVAGEEFVEVRVKDTGAGIPPEHLPHVFERFYKVDRARRDGGDRPRPCHRKAHSAGTRRRRQCRKRRGRREHVCLHPFPRRLIENIRLPIHASHNRHTGEEPAPYPDTGQVSRGLGAQGSLLEIGT